MALELIIGLGIGMFLLLAIALNLGEEHGPVKMFLIFILIYLALLLPKSAMDNCEIVLDNTTFRSSYIYGNNFTDGSGNPNYHWDYGTIAELNKPEEIITLFHVNETTVHNYKEICIESEKGTAKTYFNILLWVSRLVLFYGFIIFLMWIIDTFRKLKDG